jgi:hypothetical protein
MPAIILKNLNSIKKANVFRSFATLSNVSINEQKIKVGKYDVNFVESSIQGKSPKNVLICLPGALGKCVMIDNKITIFTQC